MQSTAIGGLGWPPAQFWDATPADYWAAVEHHDRVKAMMDAARED